ncbi:developmentally-regulated GTP-binding protein 2-like isoform X2 [Zophobas morio]|uniref:developmentally-regulated GTP-binding protein 2-like isoform X2 n=1 Tax=Zophobas morio TaxID=2755281 RepID=UPI003082796A
MGIQEKIADLEFEYARTQKNKATEYHLGTIKAKLAKLRAELLEPSTQGPKGEGFEVLKSGDARVALIGFPSVGKSTLLNSLTDTESLCANYEFTTLTCIPGVIKYKGAEIQLLDLPGIIEGAAQGAGRGRQVIAAARTADLILMVLDASRFEEQKDKITQELSSMGIRLNRVPPNISFTLRSSGGINFSSTVKLTMIDEKLVERVLKEYKIYNADVIFREDASVDDFIDVVLGKRKYLHCLYCYNKIDCLTIEEIDALARRPFSIVISCSWGLNLDRLVEKIWQSLKLIKIYTKKRGEFPDLKNGFVLRTGSTVATVCSKIHRNLVSSFSYALVWGTSTKFSPQRVGLHHVLHPDDVVQIVKKA